MFGSPKNVFDPNRAEPLCLGLFGQSPTCRFQHPLTLSLCFTNSLTEVPLVTPLLQQNLNYLHYIRKTFQNLLQTTLKTQPPPEQERPLLAAALSAWFLCFQRIERPVASALRRVAGREAVGHHRAVLLRLGPHGRAHPARLRSRSRIGAKFHSRVTEVSWSLL